MAAPFFPDQLLRFRRALVPAARLGPRVGECEVGADHSLTAGGELRISERIVREIVDRRDIEPVLGTAEGDPRPRADLAFWERATKLSTALEDSNAVLLHGPDVWHRDPPGGTDTARRGMGREDVYEGKIVGKHADVPVAQRARKAGTGVPYETTGREISSYRRDHQWVGDDRCEKRLLVPSAPADGWDHRKSLLGGRSGVSNLVFESD